MTRRKPRPSRKPQGSPPPAETKPVGLRIIGGRLRGRKLAYGGDLRVRPMKDRVREAVFNLIGPAVAGKHAVDLFAGTGALGLEAISRGAARATLIERHYPTIDVIRQNIAALGLDAVCNVVPANVLLWAERPERLGDSPPWLVFSSPPYDFYVDRQEDMLRLLGTLFRAAPAESILVVESDERFSFDALPDPQAWNVRAYPPAVIGIYRKES